MQVRSCSAADVEILERELPSSAIGVYASHFARQLADDAEFLVAWQGARPLGVAMLLREPAAPRAAAAYPAVPHIAHLQVRADARGTGVGTALVEQATGRARSRGAASVAMSVAMSVALENDRAAALYERLGFRRTNVFDDVAYRWTSRDGARHDERETEEVLLKVLHPLPAVASEVVAAARRVAGVAPLSFIGIDGFGGAGKTTLAVDLAARVPGSVLVHVDDFAAPHVPEWDWDRFRAQLLVPLLAGRTARYQVWDWHADAGREWIEVEPRGPVIVEGVSSTRAEVGAPWALTVWVDAPESVRLARARARDGEAMMAQWQNVWLPEERAWAARERPQEHLDLIVNGVGD